MRDPQIINFNGKQITYIDYSNLKDQEQIIKLIDKSCNLIKQQPGESVLSLMNVENMYFNKTVRSYLQNKVGDE